MVNISYVPKLRSSYSFDPQLWLTEMSRELLNLYLLISNQHDLLCHKNDILNEKLTK